MLLVAWTRMTGKNERQAPASHSAGLVLGFIQIEFENAGKIPGALPLRSVQVEKSDERPAFSLLTLSFTEIQRQDTGEILALLTLACVQVKEVAGQRPHGHGAVGMLGQGHGEP